jgi:hypothetical protein
MGQASSMASDGAEPGAEFTALRDCVARRRRGVALPQGSDALTARAVGS